MTKTEAKILLVDDQGFARHSLKDSLEIKGYKEVCLNDGRDVMQAIEEYKPNVVIMDTNLGLPGDVMGYDICKEVCEKYSERVAVIGMSSEYYREEWKEAGADSFWFKEIKLDGLVELIKKALEGK